MSLITRGLYFTYQPNSPYETKVLQDINLEITEGEFVGLIGHTGSGKSTLIQHFNGLLKPSAGKVYVDGQDISQKGIKLKAIRQKVGMVFQYPEHQLFEETVFKDIAFGPENMKLSPQAVTKRVKNAMRMVGLDYQRYRDLSPFGLSGGEKRRAAIAGVLAMNPRYLILDEPTAGLDPKGREEILEHIVRIHQDEGITVILVSHNMDDVARIVERLIVINQGEILYDKPVRQVFAEHEGLSKIGLDIPTVTKLMLRLQEKGWPVRTDVITVEEARDEILKVVRGGHHHA